MIGKYLWVFLISMVPIIELRGAIPVAVGMGLPLIPSYIICIIGNMLPCPSSISSHGKCWYGAPINPSSENFSPSAWKKAKKDGKKLQAKAGRGLFVALLLFVGIPLPGTGAWTGTLAASLLDMDFKSSVIAVMCGVLLAGVIMALISNGVLGALSFML